MKTIILITVLYVSWTLASEPRQKQDFRIKLRRRHAIIRRDVSHLLGNRGKSPQHLNHYDGMEIPVFGSDEHQHSAPQNLQHLKPGWFELDETIDYNPVQPSRQYLPLPTNSVPSRNYLPIATPEPTVGVPSNNYLPVAIPKPTISVPSKNYLPVNVGPKIPQNDSPSKNTVQNGIPSNNYFPTLNQNPTVDVPSKNYPPIPTTQIPSNFYLPSIETPPPKNYLPSKETNTPQLPTVPPTNFQPSNEANYKLLKQWQQQHSDDFLKPSSHQQNSDGHSNQFELKPQEQWQHFSNQPQEQWQQQHYDDHSNLLEQKHHQQFQQFSNQPDHQEQWQQQNDQQKYQWQNQVPLKESNHGFSKTDGQLDQDKWQMLNTNTHSTQEKNANFVRNPWKPLTHEPEEVKCGESHNQLEGGHSNNPQTHEHKPSKYEQNQWEGDERKKLTEVDHSEGVDSYNHGHQEGVDSHHHLEGSGFNNNKGVDSTDQENSNQWHDSSSNMLNSEAFGTGKQAHWSQHKNASPSNLFGNGQKPQHGSAVSSNRFETGARWPRWQQHGHVSSSLNLLTVEAGEHLKRYLRSNQLNEDQHEGYRYPKPQQLADGGDFSKTHSEIKLDSMISVSQNNHQWKQREDTSKQHRSNEKKQEYTSKKQWKYQNGKKQQGTSSKKQWKDQNDKHVNKWSLGDERNADESQKFEEWNQLLHSDKVKDIAAVIWDQPKHWNQPRGQKEVDHLQHESLEAKDEEENRWKEADESQVNDQLKQTDKSKVYISNESKDLKGDQWKENKTETKGRWKHPENHKATSFQDQRHQASSHQPHVEYNHQQSQLKPPAGHRLQNDFKTENYGIHFSYGNDEGNTQVWLDPTHGIDVGGHKYDHHHQGNKRPSHDEHNDHHQKHNNDQQIKNEYRGNIGALHRDYSQKHQKNKGPSDDHHQHPLGHQGNERPSQVEHDQKHQGIKDTVRDEYKHNGHQGGYHDVAQRDHQGIKDDNNKHNSGDQENMKSSLDDHEGLHGNKSSSHADQEHNQQGSLHERYKGSSHDDHKHDGHQGNGRDQRPSHDHHADNHHHHPGYQTTKKPSHEEHNHHHHHPGQQGNNKPSHGKPKPNEEHGKHDPPTSDHGKHDKTGKQNFIQNEWNQTKHKVGDHENHSTSNGHSQTDPEPYYY